MKRTIDQTRRGNRTRQQRYYFALIFIAILAATALAQAEIAMANELRTGANLGSIQDMSLSTLSENAQLAKAGGEILVEVTAYNAGDPAQTDDSPCISANGDDICTALARGHKRCAANFVPFGTRLHIENFGECLVVDRMNARYANRVDIAMNADEKQRAIRFGVQNLIVKVLK